MKRQRLLLGLLLFVIIVAGCIRTTPNQATVVMEDTLFPLQHVAVDVAGESAITDRRGEFWYSGNRKIGQFTTFYGETVTVGFKRDEVISLPKPDNWGEQYLNDLIGFNYVYVDPDTLDFEPEFRELTERPFMTTRWLGPSVSVRLDIPEEYHDWYWQQVIGYWQELVGPVLEIVPALQDDEEDILVKFVYEPELHWFGVWKRLSYINWYYISRGEICINIAKEGVADNLILHRHEFGHALGLMHSRQEGSLMYPQLSKVYNEELTPEEEHALRVLYSIPAGKTEPKISAQGLVFPDEIE